MVKNKTGFIIRQEVGYLRINTSETKEERKKGNDVSKK